MAAGRWKNGHPGRLVGRVGVMYEPRWSGSPPKDEIGWTIARESWGHGFATVAARTALDDAFNRIGLARVVSFTRPDNRDSRRVMEKCGFVYQGVAEWAGEHVWYERERRA